jgi:hypothetical protein
LSGPGSYANFTVTPDRVEGLSPEPMPDATAGDPRYLRQWLAGSPTTLPVVVDAKLKVAVGDTVTYAGMPGKMASWKNLAAQRAGLINLNREYGALTGESKISRTWLKTEVDSDKTQIKSVYIGWLDEIWVFVNGKLVFADRNLWDTDAAKKQADGRLALSNGTFDLPLRLGQNEVVIAIDNNVSDGLSHHFGWGFEIKLSDIKGLSLSEPSSDMH